MEQQQPPWADLLPEALSKIFSLLPFDDLLRSVPLVCSAWRSASLDAVSWDRVDLSHWSRGKDTQTYSRMLSLVIERSQGAVKQLVAPNLIKDSMFRIIASGGQFLEALQIPDNALSDNCLCQLAPKFPSLTYLNIKGRCFTSEGTVEAYGKHCPFIERFAVESFRDSFATSMPRLKHLELSGDISNNTLEKLLENCNSLEQLDLRGCWSVSLGEASILRAKSKLQVFLLPLGHDNSCPK